MNAGNVHEAKSILVTATFKIAAANCFFANLIIYQFVGLHTKTYHLIKQYSLKFLPLHLINISTELKIFKEHSVGCGRLFLNETGVNFITHRERYSQLKPNEGWAGIFGRLHYLGSFFDQLVGIIVINVFGNLPKVIKSFGRCMYVFIFRYSIKIIKLLKFWDEKLLNFNSAFLGYFLSINNRSYVT